MQLGLQLRESQVVFRSDWVCLNFLQEHSVTSPLLPNTICLLCRWCLLLSPPRECTHLLNTLLLIWKDRVLIFYQRSEMKYVNLESGEGFFLFLFHSEELLMAKMNVLSLKLWGFFIYLIFFPVKIFFKAQK